MKNLDLLECGFREKLEEIGIEKIIAHLYPFEMVCPMGQSELIEAVLERDDVTKIVEVIVEKRDWLRDLM